MSRDERDPSPANKLPAPVAQPPHSRPHVWLLGLMLLLGLAGWAVYGQTRRDPQGVRQDAPAAADRPDGASSKKKGRPGGGPPLARSMPVSVATAARGDLPITLEAPGTVIAFNTVTVRTRVDGQIVKVNFTEGEMVHEGDLLFKIDPRPFQVQLSQAQGQLARDEATLRNAKLDLDRYQGARRAFSQQQLDTAQAQMDQAAGAVKVDQAQIDNAKLQLTYCGITAPLGGRIGLRLVDQGNIVRAGDAGGLAVITQVEPITVAFSLSEDYLPQVMKASGGGRKLPVEVSNRTRTTRLGTGTLLAVDSQIDLATLTARFKAVFDNKDHALFPNQAVNVKLLVDTIKGAVRVPAAALQRSPEAAFVYVVKPDSTVEMRTVTPGPGEGETISIAQGLGPGEVVVTDGLDKLEPGMKVTVPAAQGAASHEASASPGAPAGRGGYAKRKKQ